MFLKYLNKFKSILREEEKLMSPTPTQGLQLSELIQRSEDDGSVWLHMVLRNAFNAYDDFACAQLIATTPDWEKLGEDVIDRGKAQPFIDRKLEENKKKY